MTRWRRPSIIVGTFLCWAACGGASKQADDLAAPLGDLAALFDGGDADGSAEALLSRDCTGQVCPTLTLQGDPPAGGLFHGYADPSMRKDPSSDNIMLAYSWAHTLADHSIVVDLHLAHSADGGGSWSFDGALYSTAVVDEPVDAGGDGGIAASNHSSNEVIDLFPVARSGSTLWIQAHMAYLVPAGSDDIYGQLFQSEYISVSALSVPSGAATSAVLGLASAPEAHLGSSFADPTRVSTALDKLSPALAHCARFDQPSLYAVDGTLYLALECFEQESTGLDANAFSFAMFSAPLNGDDVTGWTWSYLGLFGTGAEAKKLGAVEGTAYQFFTEVELVPSMNGGLLALLVPSVLTTTGHQPVIQYGCRAFPIADVASPALPTDSTGAPLPVARVTASDLYTDGNEGPGACTYEPASSTGIVIMRKLEADPTLGFYGQLQASGVRP